MNNPNISDINELPAKLVGEFAHIPFFTEPLADELGKRGYAGYRISPDALVVLEGGEADIEPIMDMMETVYYSNAYGHTDPNKSNMRLVPQPLPYLDADGVARTGQALLFCMKGLTPKGVRKVQYAMVESTIDLLAKVKSPYTVPHLPKPAEDDETSGAA